MMFVGNEVVRDECLARMSSLGRHGSGGPAAGPGLTPYRWQRLHWQTAFRQPSARGLPGPEFPNHEAIFDDHWMAAGAAREAPISWVRLGRDMAPTAPGGPGVGNACVCVCARVHACGHVAACACAVCGVCHGVFVKHSLNLFVLSGPFFFCFNNKLPF